MSEPNVAVRLHPNSRRTCPYCRAALLENEATWACPGCGVAHHSECASENTRCAIHGCGRPAPIVVRTATGKIQITLRPAPPSNATPCAACRSGIADGELSWLCPACNTLHHDECAQNLGRCSNGVCGRLRRPFGARVIPKEERPAFLSARFAVTGAGLGLLALGLASANGIQVRPERAPTAPGTYWTWVAVLVGAFGATTALTCGAGAPVGWRLAVPVAFVLALAILTSHASDFATTRAAVALLGACVIGAFGIVRERARRRSGD